MMPLFLREKSSLKGRWRLETVQDMRSSGSNPVSCSETSIKIYGSKEEIRARKSPETVDAPGFAPDASIPVILYGMPDWIRTSGLQSRSYQAVRPQALRRKGLIGVAQISAILKKNLGSLVGQGFRGFLQQ